MYVYDCIIYKIIYSKQHYLCIYFKIAEGMLWNICYKCVSGVMELRTLSVGVWQMSAASRNLLLLLSLIAGHRGTSLSPQALRSSEARGSWVQGQSGQPKPRFKVFKRWEGRFYLCYKETKASPVCDAIWHPGGRERLTRTTLGFKGSWYDNLSQQTGE